MDLLYEGVGSLARMLCYREGVINSNITSHSIGEGGGFKTKILPLPAFCVIPIKFFT